MTDKIKINHIAFIGKSTLNILQDVCAICRENVCDKCTKCAQESIDNKKNTSCYSVIGTCNHAFHHCCIKKFIGGLATVSQKCPLCNKKWELKKRTVGIIESGNKYQYQKKLHADKNKGNDLYDDDDNSIDEIENEFNNQTVNGLLMTSQMGNLPKSFADKPPVSDSEEMNDDTTNIIGTNDLYTDDVVVPNVITSKSDDVIKNNNENIESDSEEKEKSDSETDVTESDDE